MSQIQNKILDHPQQVRGAQPRAHGEDAEPPEDAAAASAPGARDVGGGCGWGRREREREWDAPRWDATGGHAWADGRRLACPWAKRRWACDGEEEA